MDDVFKICAQFSLLLFDAKIMVGDEVDESTCVFMEASSFNLLSSKSSILVGENVRRGHVCIMILAIYL